MELRTVLEVSTPFGYQASNVLHHLNENGGKINTSDERLKCRKVEGQEQILPVSSKAVQLCSKYKSIDEDMQRLNR